MKRLLTYGLLLLTILASPLIMSACQDDLPDTTEVMMTFTTRAVVTQNNENDVINVEKMQDLRVIVVRENGDIVYNDTKSVGGESTATVSFNTPVKTGGENFKFFAIANYSSLVNEPNYTDIDGLITHKVGDGNEIPISNPIPQTKYWVYPVKQLLGQTQSITKTLDYLASKISVQFINNTNKTQSLSNIYITGITPNGKGRLFNEPTGLYNDEGEEIYKEVYVTNDVTLTDNKIAFNAVTDLAAGASSAIQHYYTYPVDADNMSSPILYATWGDEVEPRTLALTGISELKRNDHLQILITLTDVGIKVTYTIADWEKNTTTIGGVNPTLGDGYMVPDWETNDEEDVVIGDEPDEEVLPGDVIWSKTLNLTLTGSIITHSDDFTTKDESYFVAGRTFGMSIEYIPNNWGAIVFMERGKGWDGKIPTFAEMGDRDDGGITITGNCTIEFVLTQTDVEMILRGNGVEFWGNGVTITQIYIKSPSTQ